MPNAKLFLHALRCMDDAAAAAERSAAARERADRAASRASEFRVLTDERLGWLKDAAAAQPDLRYRTAASRSNR